MSAHEGARCGRLRRHRVRRPADGGVSGRARAGGRAGRARRAQPRPARAGARGPGGAGGRGRAALGRGAAAWPVIAADSQDARAVGVLAESAKVVATTVGPYAKYGMPLVQACAAAGTHYADLAGEVLFMRRSIDTVDAPARASGARIVHCCGFDSIPSDLGVWLLHRAAADAGAGDLEETTLVLRAVRGGVSGGTIDSVRGTIDEARASAESRRVLGDPYALSPDRDAEPRLGSERDGFG